ncbi:aspartyl-tRNA synthetase [Aspergillus sclerotiicarbonarius CBS 121057]|uniref:Aspartyl-tRNA synthetase n=1 Tax=Aspergillus sclerotiicarbonarius (strain CBS 121057 / IBT 28362) TaxID=1448318 RepID=A0A319EK08_ASPSB|nr:aspartyl-tRNA synthetase [Aspergillus sclerotiicarbonarius CBS 121057]
MLTSDTKVEFSQATWDIDTLRSEGHEGLSVVLHGYLDKRDDMGKELSFVPLFEPNLNRSIQLLSNESSKTLSQLKKISRGSPVVIKGTVKRKVSRTPEQELADPWEVVLESIQPLNEFPREIVMFGKQVVHPPKHRHLQLRASSELRDALRFRAKARNVCREVLEQSNPAFVEIETPLLFKSTPEGAREFIVPTRKKGKAYALPQSPQQYKQILMASGMPRYFQFARCFRDEDLRADRQPEFTQLDMEMAFASGKDVMKVVESLIRGLWSNLMEEVPPQPFRRMTYQEAMTRYGSDKPDTRHGMEIHRIEHILPTDLVQKITPLTEPIVEAFKVETIDQSPRATREFISRFLDSREGESFNKNPDGAPGIFIYDASTPLNGLGALGFEAAEKLEQMLDLNHGDLIILQARPQGPFAGGSTQLGALRRALAPAAIADKITEAPEGFEFLWIVDFPLFTPLDGTEPGQGGTAGFSATHHPFTAPKTAADVDLLSTDPTKAIADHYDLVVNGVELGGGSRRIHCALTQNFIFKQILGMPKERVDDFQHLLSALWAGCPPHAGFALGFDRLVAVMLGKESVRDVIAFPKIGKMGEDPMVKAPSKISEEVAKLYGLRR